MKKKEQKYKGFNLIENTTGIILNGVYIKNDFSEIIVSMAWGWDLHFKPESDIKKQIRERRQKNNHHA